MAEERGEPWRIESYRNRLRTSLSARFLLRYHVALILAASIAAGAALDALLLREGMRIILLRYPVAIVGAYLVFLGGVAAWLRYSGIREYIDRRKAAELVGDDVPMAPYGATSGPDDWAQLLNMPAEPEGCLWVMLAIVLFFALGGYIVMTAPALFSDVVLELMLAAGLLRGVRRGERSGWVRGVWANTWGTLVFTLVVALFIGLFAQNTVPPSSTLHELWDATRHPKGLPH